MTRDEFIDNLEKLLPSYLKLSIKDPEEAYHQDCSDISIDLEHNGEINLIFWVDTDPFGDSINFSGYEYDKDDGTFCLKSQKFTDFNTALEYFKTVSLDSITRLKRILETLDWKAINNTLTDLGFTRRGSHLYTYELRGADVCIETLDLEETVTAPFRLIVYKGNAARHSEYFLTLDALLDYIVNGGR